MVSFRNFKSQNFKLSVSNPKNKYVAYLSVLSQISNCQGLGRKNNSENLRYYQTIMHYYNIFHIYHLYIMIMHYYTILCIIYIYIYHALL